MKIAIIGAGYVGLSSAVIFAHIGHTVWVIDNNREKIERIKSGQVPFFEPKLAEFIKKGLKNKRLIPICSYKKGVSHADVIFICVGTPPLVTGQADLSYIFSAAKEIAKNMHKYAVIVNKSTVPVGTAEKVKETIKKIYRGDFDIASCPEFLREGHAIENTLNPARIVIGVESQCAAETLLELHKKLSGQRVITDIYTAEIAKYASNAFLATKISFINEIANLCESLDANVEDVALIMGIDPRIGKAFLRAGIGYGGSCFPKDTRALHHMALSNFYEFKLIKTVIEVNRLQRAQFFKKIKTALRSLKNKNIGALGLAFKNNTDDVRESAALDIINQLIKKGAHVKAYDPKANENAKKIIPALEICKRAEDVANGADAILVLTEWLEFRKLQWDAMKNKMNRPLIIDGRNLLNPNQMRKLGFEYISVGRP